MQIVQLEAIESYQFYLDDDDRFDFVFSDSYIHQTSWKNHLTWYDSLYQSVCHDSLDKFLETNKLTGRTNINTADIEFYLSLDKSSLVITADLVFDLCIRANRIKDAQEEGLLGTSEQMESVVGNCVRIKSIGDGIIPYLVRFDEVELDVIELINF